MLRKFSNCPHIGSSANQEQEYNNEWPEYPGYFTDGSVKLCPSCFDKQGLNDQQNQPHHQQCSVNVDGSCFVYEIWELAGVMFIESPLYANHNQDDEDGRVAVNFQHGLLVWWFAEDIQNKQLRQAILIQTKNAIIAMSLGNFPDLDGLAQ